MTGFYRRHPVYFALIGIWAYMSIMGLADHLSSLAGMPYLISAPAALAMVCCILTFAGKYGLQAESGLGPFRGQGRDFLYFLPMAAILSTNLWGGLRLPVFGLQTVLFALTMLCVGFLEEFFFRGVLFPALCRKNFALALTVSSLAFGISHLFNLLSGHTLLPTLLQMFYACAMGFLFTVIFYRGKSLWPCAAAHGIFNILSIFSADGLTPARQIVQAAVLTLLSAAYGLWLLDVRPKIRKGRP